MPARIECIEKEELQKLYDDKGMLQREIADYYGVNRITIRRRMKEYGIKAHRGYSNGRKYSINQKFFKSWTPSTAWMFGWSLGDGNYTNSKCLNFELARVDREVLEKFKTVMESEHKIHDREVWKEKYQKFYKQSAIYFCSKELVSDLNKRSFRDIPEYYFNHALRGFFEAEGCVFWQAGYIGSNIAQNDKELLEFIWLCLEEFGIVNGGWLSSHENASALSFSTHDSISLYHYMYDNCGNIMFLKRKKTKFEELIRTSIVKTGCV